MNRKNLYLCFACGFVLAGCAEQPHPVDVPVARAKALTPEGDSSVIIRPEGSPPYDVSIGGYKFSAPGPWAEQPRKNDFVLGEFSVPGKGGVARLTISSAGGTIESNLSRWRDQFQRGPNDAEPRESSITFDGKSGTLIELQGRFSDMGSQTQKENSRMLGVAVPLDGTNFFIKMTGPAATIEQRRDEFVTFVESARKAN